LISQLYEILKRLIGTRDWSFSPWSQSARYISLPISVMEEDC